MDAGASDPAGRMDAHPAGSLCRTQTGYSKSRAVVQTEPNKRVRTRVTCSAFSESSIDDRLRLAEPSEVGLPPASGNSLVRGLLSSCERYFGGNLPHWVILWILLPLYTSCAIATPLITANRFPEPFDIRNRVITNLASWRDNPDGHQYFGLGLGLMMLFLIPFPGNLRRNLKGSRTMRHVGHLLLRIGIIGGLVLSVESGIVAGLRNLWGVCGKAHEIYAVVAFAGLGLGGIAFGICTIQSAVRSGAAARSARVLVPTLFLGMLVVTTLLELVLYLLSYVSGWDRENAGRHYLLNFAFWEWMSAASMLLILQALEWEACMVRRRDVVQRNTACEPETPDRAPHSQTSRFASNTGPSTHTRL